MEKGKKYFLSRNESTLIAFTTPRKFDAFKTGYKIIGTHTDSPVLKLAPNSRVSNKQGFSQCNVVPYGGGLWHTWFDRPLGVAGKVIVKDQNAKIINLNWNSKTYLLFFIF